MTSYIYLMSIYSIYFIVK